MEGLIDIHAHLLPGIDDGPKDMPAALSMARAAVETGIATMALTPHVGYDFPMVRPEELDDRAEQLRTALRDEEIALDVIVAGEVSVSWALNATDRDLRLVSYGQQGHDLLIETPNHAPMIESLVMRLRGRGMRLTLAHPERSREFQLDPNRLEKMHADGILLQVNAHALLESSSKWPPHILAHRLLRRGLADAVASDSHRAASWRPVTDLAKALQKIERSMGTAQTEWMSRLAPGAIVAGKEIPARPQ